MAGLNRIFDSSGLFPLIKFDEEAGGAAGVATPAPPAPKDSGVPDVPSGMQAPAEDVTGVPPEGDSVPPEGDSVPPEGEAPSAMGEAPKVEGEAPEAEGEEASNQDEGSGDVPESYADIELPEGITVAPEELEHFTPVLQELKVDAEAYPKLVEALHSWRQQELERSNALIEEGRNNDYAQLRADNDLGGTDEHFEAQMAQAGRFMLLPGGPEVMSLFRAHGIDNNLPLVRLFHTIGGMLAEDTLVNGQGGAGQGEVNPIDAAFPTTANK